MWILIVLFIFLIMNDSILVTTTRIKTNKINKSIKLAVVSDFHNTNAEIVIRHVHDIHPDAVLIPGDVIDENFSMKSTEKLFKGLSPWPVYFVSGNHEYKKGRTYSDFNQLKQLLDKYRIVSVDNDFRTVELKEQKIWIGGIKDHCSDKTKDPDELDQKNIDLVCRNLDDKLFSVLMMHRPEQYQMLEPYSIDLVVSGHAHGGQWRLPGINGLFAPQQGLFPKRAGGVYPMKHGIHLVSRGLAHYWFLPRILNHREINVIEIERAD